MSAFEEHELTDHSASASAGPATWQGNDAAAEVPALQSEPELDEIEFDGEDYSDETPVEIMSRKINTGIADPAIETLHSKYKRGKLDIQPFFQRQYVWDRKKASCLIESALLGVPLPTVYLAEETDGVDSVIDGQQRLTSFFRYVDGDWDGKKFTLTGLKVITELNGLTFKDLDSNLQERILSCSIRTITFRNDSDPDLKFEVFERLNRGSVTLNDMELRNCIYRGRYMALLKQLSQEPLFVEVVGLKSPDKRMADVELVLRFAAFYHSTFLKYREPMRGFLNKEMEDNKSSIELSKAQRLIKAFRNALSINKSLFGSNAFRRFIAGNEKNPQGTWKSTSINKALFDVLMSVFAETDKNQVYQCMDSIREAIIDLMTSNQGFIDAISAATGDAQRIERRFELVRTTVKEVMKSTSKQERCFTLALKQQLYDAEPTCSICGQNIRIIDDAAVDHVKQYWLGGQTVLENARLTHRFCNNARPRVEA